MPSIGPTLPPHLRSEDTAPPNEEDFPSPPAKRQRSSSPTSTQSQKRRVVGPSLPPAPLSERPTTSPNGNSEAKPTTAISKSDSDSSDDDDFGPAPPPIAGSKSGANTDSDSIFNRPITTTPPPAQKAQREEWMLAPPTADSLSSTSRMDPTKIKNRKFATGRAANAGASSGGGGGGGGIGRTWTETPEQKRQRLADEVLGVAAPANSGTNNNGGGSADTEARVVARKAEEAREAERRIREFNEQDAKRGAGSLVDQHIKGKGGKREEEDDPSKRAFDREKDMKLGGAIGAKGQADMMRRAKDMGGRFSGGSYL